MAIECFKIEWTKPFPLDTIATQQESRRGGIYALFQGNSRRAFYIGKATRFDQRLVTHKQSFYRMLKPAQRNKLYVRLGIVQSFEISSMSDVISGYQLASIENFFITRLPNLNNGENTKKKDTCRYPLVIANTGNLFSGIDKYMSQNKELLKLFGKSTTIRKKRVSSWP
ncbi:MAG: hypothetical protein A2144_09755 [Chloroflexi bacterium RBG_16_50_9]|nr:MAG: hypothetical protein A2144_09755 [Chloroflexi bacterium RBG_16_50_9]